MLLWRNKLSNLQNITKYGLPAYKSSSVVYCYNPKFSDKQVWKNSADPDQPTPRGAV